MTLASAVRPPCDQAQIGAQPVQPACPRRDKPWVLATAILGSSLAFIEGSAVNLALPAIQADLDVSSAGLQWVVNAYLLMLGSLMLIGGSLGDRYGLRRIFILGVFIFGASSVICGLADSLPLLIAARLLQGLGGALLVPSSLALIGSYFDEHERGRAIGTWAGASALTTAIGPVIGGWLVDLWGWPAVFYFVPLLAALTAGIAWWRVPAGAVRRSDKLDYPGAIFLAAALGLLIYALVNPGAQAQRLVLLLVAFLLGACFIWRELRFTAPMLPLSLFRSRAFSGANLVTLLLYSALSGALYFLPFNLIQVQQYSALQAGAAFLPLTLILGFGSTFAGDLIRRFDPRLVLALGPMVAAAGFMALAIPGRDADFVSGFLPGIAIVGVGMTLSVAPLTTVVMGSVPERQAGVASGVNNTAARLAGVIAVGALTAVAVGYFGGVLERRLQQAELPPSLVTQLAGQASQLAELQAPAEVPEPAAATVASSVALAYVDTFRMLMVVCGVLAALSGLIAWVSLQPGQRKKRPQE